MNDATTQPETLSSLMQLSLGGDNAAYRTLLDQCASIARGYVLRRLSHKDSVDDIVQEVLIAVHKAKHTYHPDRPFKPWLFAIVHYKLQDHLRKHYRHAEIDANSCDYDDLLHAAVDDDICAARDSTEEAEALLAGLNEKQRFLLTQTKIEGYSHKEVARQTGMSESAVKVAVHRIIKRLQTTRSA